VPVTPALRVAYAASLAGLAKWLLLQPLVFKYQMSWKVAAIGFAFYAAFQVAYLPTALSGNS
jgi:uncharacterized membrane protein